MSKKKNTPALQTTVGPNIEDLKSKFVAHSIPLEADFANLIDVADCGRKAAGLSPDVDTPATDTGLMLDSTTGQLKVKPETDKGISVTDSGVGVVANAAKGIIVDGSGVGVVANAAKGIIVDGSGVGVVANAAKGIIVDGSGVGVVANVAKGVTVDGNGVGIVANVAKGVTVDAAGVGINYDSSLGVSNNALGVVDDAFYLSRKKLSASITTSTTVLKAMMVCGLGTQYYAKVAVSCNGVQHFVISILGNNLAGSNNASLSISNVAGYSPSSPIKRILVGHNYNYSCIVSLEIDSSASVEITYSITDIDGFLIYPLDRTIDIASAVAAVPDSFKEVVC
ncbi:hypothetical protein [Yokenella regensburgei]|uniref:hypothetical protein n=1 Tax=Yokenella regensburgei TaxID=158877 RepID=UPI003ED917FA